MPEGTARISFHQSMELNQDRDTLLVSNAVDLTISTKWALVVSVIEVLGVVALGADCSIEKQTLIDALTELTEVAGWIVGSSDA
jgi:hypothetical protein